MENNINNKFLSRDISQELKDSYLQYAMSVIISRALPDARDGLKPVQRRILFAMQEDGLRPGAKFRKAANVVGSCMGRYHPHGDLAIYDTLVRMAQDFSLRYPLIEGQGNIGSIDGDPPAAMRYLEARLANISEPMLLDIEKDTVDWMTNYDGTRKEPKVLPAKLPNLLLNGAMGIAVGMATNIPPHNLNEVLDAVTHLIDYPDATVNDLMNYILGPDFPTGGIIYGKEKIKEAYANGRGAILMRAKSEIIEEKKQIQIIITEIPYQVNKSNLISSIARLVEEKKIEGIKDLRDESDKDGLRIVIDLKEGSFSQRIQNQLFKYTELEKTFHLNSLALVEGGLQPEILSLKDLLEEYLNHRKNVVYRRTRYLLGQAEARAHILEGLKKASDHIDEIIALIKASENREDAKQKLISKFKFSDIQANAILETKLQALAKLEQYKIKEELKEKKQLIVEYNLILKDPKKILKIIKEELQEVKEKYGDLRKTKIVNHLPQEIIAEDLIPQKNVLITLSQGGYIKRLPEETFKTQTRGGKGVTAYEAKDDDFLINILSVNTHDNLWFFTNKGRLFKIKAYEIPEAQRTSRGKALQNYLNLSTDEKVEIILRSEPKNEESHLILATKNGIIKKTSLEEYQNIHRNGLYTIKLLRDDLLGWASFCKNKDEIILITKKGQAIRFQEKDIRSQGRVTAGVTGIRLGQNDAVVGMIIIKQDIKDKKPQILVISENGFGKRTILKDYRLQKRGGVGTRTIKITPKTGDLARAALVQEQEFIIAISQQGQTIKANLNEIPVLSRATQGVRIMKLNEADKVSSITIL